MVIAAAAHDEIRLRPVEERDLEILELYGDLPPEDWVGGTDCLHPDASGYDKVTVAFLEVLGLN